MKYLFCFFIGLYFFSIPLDGLTQSFLPVSNLSRLTSFVIIILYIYSLIKAKRIYYNKFILSLVILVFWGLVTLAWDSMRAMEDIFNFLSFFVTWFVIIQLFYIYKIKLSKNLWLYILGCVIVSVITLIFGETIGGNRFTVNESYNPNILSSTLVLGLCCIILLWSQYNKNIKLVFIVISSLLLLTILLTQSRTAIFSLLLAALIILLYQMLFKWKSIIKKINTIKLIQFAFLFIITIGITNFIFKSGFDNLNITFNDLERFNKSFEDSSEFTSGRVDIWENHFEIWKDYPITGSGIESAEYIHEKYYGYTRKVHNTYIKILVEFGIVGFMLFSLILFRMALEIKYIISPSKKIALIFLMFYLIFSGLGNDILNYAYGWVGLLFFQLAVIDSNRTTRREYFE